MKRNELFYLRNIDDVFFISPSDDLEENKKGMIILNESSAFLWDNMVEGFTIDSLVKALSDRYEVSNEIATVHVTEFVSFLFENGCLEK